MQSPIQETNQRTIRRHNNGSINTEYYQERALSLRADAFKQSIRAANNWFKKQNIHLVHSIEVIQERHKAHKKCEQ